jgi:hypothetical protein
VETQCNEAKTRAVLKGVEMLKGIMTHIRAAVTLIATEDFKALRALFKNIADFASKSVRVDKKT